MILGTRRCLLAMGVIFWLATIYLCFDKSKTFKGFFLNTVTLSQTMNDYNTTQTTKPVQVQINKSEGNHKQSNTDANKKKAIKSVEPTGPMPLSPCIPDKAKRNAESVVPKIIHYIWFHSSEKCNFEFHHFMSFLSAYKYIKPIQIIVWYDYFPCGSWWNETKSKVPILKFERMLPPEFVFGQRIKVVEHKSDVARLDILFEHGGIYMDTDMVALKSWDPLLYYDTTLGAESTYDLASGVIITKKNASFLRLWKDSYHKFRDNQWGLNSVIMAFRLAKKNPHLVHVEWNTLVFPNWLNTMWIHAKNKLWDWSNLYGMHLYYRAYKSQHNLEDIKTLNSTLGEIFRLIYYNTTKIIK